MPTKNSESKFHFPGVIATVIGGFTQNFLHISFQATPGNRKKGTVGCVQSFPEGGRCNSGIFFVALK